MIRTLLATVVAIFTLGLYAGDSVIVYTALDREFSEPILKAFETETGIKALVVYDTEVDKSVGLVNKLRAEKKRPRCDVFWNNEIVNTLRLKKEGVLQPYKAKAAQDFPSQFRDKDHYWHGFAGRARILIVNTDLVKPADMPHSIKSLLDPKWKGKCALARPLAGTTASHAACLFAEWGEVEARAFFMGLKANEVKVESGNKQVALNVSAGRLAFGLTDTDDAMVELLKGKPVTIIYPDSGADQSGVLFIPNTLSLIKGAPNAENGQKLIDYLLSPAVETALANSSSAQIPLGKKVKIKARVKTANDVKPMDVDFQKAADAFDKAAQFIRKEFLR